MVRVQSPDVGRIVSARLLNGMTQPSLELLPGVLPVVSVPYYEYCLFSEDMTHVEADAARVTTPVPADEDWIITQLSIEHPAGDGHIDRLLVTHPWHFPGGGELTTIIAEPISAFPYVNNSLYLPMPSGSWLYMYCDFVSVHDDYTVAGLFLRRKW